MVSGGSIVGDYEQKLLTEQVPTWIPRLHRDMSGLGQLRCSGGAAGTELHHLSTRQGLRWVEKFVAGQ